MKSLCIVIVVIFLSCNNGRTEKVEINVPQPAVINDTAERVDNTSARENETLEPFKYGSSAINTGNTNPADVVAFATTLIGTNYLYGSADPAAGFDCSGFITYVFNHFKIAVPRSSKDFTNVGTTIEVNEAKPGDLILFTGTDSAIREVGHMGIVTENNNGQLQFIHSTSGKAYGVTVTPLNDYYKGRFVKVTRIFTNID